MRKEKRKSIRLGFHKLESPFVKSQKTGRVSQVGISVFAPQRREGFHTLESPSLPRADPKSEPLAQCVCINKWVECGPAIYGTEMEWRCRWIGVKTAERRWESGRGAGMKKIPCLHRSAAKFSWAVVSLRVESVAGFTVVESCSLITGLWFSQLWNQFCA